ncbi:MAG: prolyl oligopeptidase family serine peptidase [Pseudohongiellaceae bacterium]
MNTDTDDDPWLWLEEVDGARALAWAAEQNALSAPRLQGDPRFETIRAEIHAILTSEDRIPAPGLINGQVYNFWQDSEHVRGILRRTSLDSYATDNPQWETVLDIDSLANLENANWVYKGRTCLPADPGLCLLQLSDGGKDAVVLREFDLDEHSFVDGGFYVAEAKSRVDWLDADTLIIGSDFGPDSLTDSGYPRTLRLWRRGTSLQSAQQIIEVERQDVSVSVNTISNGENQHTFVRRGPDFFTEENWLLNNDATLAKLPLPVDAILSGTLGPYALVRLRTDWSAPDGNTYTAGSLIAMDLMQSVQSGSATGLTTILDPSSDNRIDAISGVAITSEAIYITALKDVAAILLRAEPVAGNWAMSQVALPGNGALQVVTADDYSDTIMVSYESFLVPDTLYLVEANTEPRIVKSLQPRFDASHFVTEQKFARSADGTRIPYFIVRPVNIPMDGTTATEMTAYGGFEVSETPSYVGALDQAWITRGGAFVLANIRGGGEYGPQWHQSAILENRQRVFDDFIAVAEDLIASGLTSAEHLGIRGGSNGGLLVTGVMVQRPELYKAIISSVPLVDMLRYHRLLAGASWMAEYGNPDIPAHREFISAYSPYQNVSADADYPEIFLWTNPKDDRVHPGHARKMAARMIEQGHDIIYFENQEGGHGGGANLNQLARTNAMQVVYLMQQLMD